MPQQHENFAERQSRPKSKRGLKNDAVDRAFVEYFQAKKARVENTPCHNTSDNSKSEALKMFLLSMLPDLEKMTDVQIRQFKRQTLQTVDDILSPHSYSITPTSTFQVTPSGDSTNSSDIASARQTEQYSPLDSNVVERHESSAADGYYHAVGQVFTPRTAMYELYEEEEPATQQQNYVKKC